VEEGSLAELRHLSSQTIEVSFDGPAPDIPPLANVRVTVVRANALRLEVLGPVGPVIAALIPYPITTFTTKEPSLEEIFLHHYDSVGAHDG
jgi:ABC-2 type transport system ATP-binding protein